MTKTLLTNGNTKLGPNIAVWSLPSVDTCPGRTSLCEKLCYARRMEAFRGIDYSPKLEATKRQDFVKRMAEEAAWRILVRVHAAGDFNTEGYIEDWIRIAKQTPKTSYYAYTRSWRIPKLLKKLMRLKSLPNFRLLFSCDKESGIPKWAKKDDVVWMATEDQDIPPRQVKIVFRVKRKTRIARMNKSVVCPVEMGVDNEVTCEKCRLCFK